MNHEFGGNFLRSVTEDSLTEVSRKPIRHGFYLLFFRNNLPKMFTASKQIGIFLSAH